MVSTLLASAAATPRSSVSTGKRLLKLAHAVKGTGTGPRGESWTDTRKMVRSFMASVKSFVLTCPELWALFLIVFLSFLVEVPTEVAVIRSFCCSSPASDSSDWIRILVFDPTGFCSDEGGRLKPRGEDIWEEPKAWVSWGFSPLRDKNDDLASFESFFESTGQVKKAGSWVSKSRR